jgi:hypothetical protein
MQTVKYAHRDWMWSIALAGKSDTLYSAGGDRFDHSDYNIKAWQLMHSNQELETGW